MAEAGEEFLLSCPKKTSGRLLSRKNIILTYSLTQNVGPTTLASGTGTPPGSSSTAS